MPRTTAPIRWSPVTTAASSGPTRASRCISGRTTRRQATPTATAAITSGISPHPDRGSTARYRTDMRPGGRDCAPPPGRFVMDGSYAWSASPLFSKCFEGADRTGVLDAGNALHLLVDEMGDVRAVVDVEGDHEIEFA